jgi:hypothetical protein
MLKTLFKHYVLDIGLTAMFDNMVVNFTNGNNLHDRYNSYTNKSIAVFLTRRCVEERNLPVDVISGILIQATDEVLKIRLSNISAELLGWEGNIYLYNEDIYKLC